MLRRAVLIAALAGCTAYQPGSLRQGPGSEAAVSGQHATVGCLDVAILREARIVLDDVAQASESGEVNVPLHRGDLARSAVGVTLGRVVAGLEPGRRTDDEITVFDSTGLAVQDLALARVVYRRAVEENVGREVDFLA